jgi:Bacterial Ig-like domain
VLGLSTSHAKEAFAGGTTPQITSTRPPDPGHGSSGPSGPLAPPPTGPAGDTPSTKPANPTEPPEPAGPSQPTPPPVTSAGDTKTPELTLTLQPAGPFIKTQTPTFSGTAGRANGDQPTVTIRIYAASGELQSTLRTAPRDPAGSYSVAPDANSPLPEGEYTARAEQRDEAGNVGQAAVTFTVDVTKPVLAIASPKDGASTFETTPTFGGTAGAQLGDNQQVSVVIFETPPAGEIRLVRILETLPPATPDQRGIWSVKSPTALATGVRYTARATQTDRAGNTGSVTATFSVQSVPR